MLAVVCLATTADAQLPTLISRADAVAATLSKGARFAFARADSAAGRAQLIGARAFQNPVVSGAYTKSTPNYHVTLEIPFDLLTGRGARVGAARAANQSAQYRFAFERASSALDGDTTYTHALAARDRLALSRRNAVDADSLRRMAIVRRNAGDASDLDVELATVAAGQAANIAASDSLSYVSSLLDLQTVMGLSADNVSILPTDSLGSPPAIEVADSIVGTNAATLQIASAQAAVESARLATRFQRWGLLGPPALMAGFETGDPTAAEPGILPTFGIAMPFPLFNFNRGAVKQAEAEQARARAQLAFVEAQTKADLARTRRELTIAQSRLARDRTLLTSAGRVAAMSLTAYRAGAAALPNVLEAQRNAREVQSQYIDDLAAAWIAGAELRVLTLTPARAP